MYVRPVFRYVGHTVRIFGSRSLPTSLSVPGGVAFLTSSFDNEKACLYPAIAKMSHCDFINQRRLEEKGKEKRRMK